VNFFNPAVQSALVVTLQQQLLNGFGRFINRRNIMIAKNNRKLADYVFEAQSDHHCHQHNHSVLGTGVRACQC